MPKALIKEKPPATTREELTKEVSKTLALGELRDEYTRTYYVSKGLYHVLKDVPGEKEKILNNIPGMKDAEMEFIEKGGEYYIKITAVPKVSVAQLKKMKLIKTDESEFMEKFGKASSSKEKEMTKEMTEAFESMLESFKKYLKKIKLDPKQKKEVLNMLDKAYEESTRKETEKIIKKKK